MNQTESWFPWNELATKYGRVSAIYPTLIAKLEEIFKSTPTRTIANYMILRFIEFNLQEISDTYLNLIRDKNEESNWKSWCKHVTDNHFSIPLISQYIKKFSRELYHGDIVENGILDNIKMQFLKQMRKVIQVL